MRIAVLALQGAFAEHCQKLSRLGAQTMELRKKEDLHHPFDALILPGGESTVMGKLLRELDMFEILQKKILHGLPTWGTCAGMILLAKKLENDSSVHLGTMDITVKRNAYGRQLGSFHTLSSFGADTRVPMTFNIIFALPILAALGLITFGIGCFLLHYGVFIEDLYNVVHIGLRLVFYMTGIFWNITTRLPAPYGEIICHVNPIAFLLSSMRDSILYGRTPNLPLLALWLAVGLLLSVIGVRKIYRNENSYVKVI